MILGPAFRVGVQGEVVGGHGVCRIFCKRGHVWCVEDAMKLWTVSEFYRAERRLGSTGWGRVEGFVGWLGGELTLDVEQQVPD